VFFFYLNVGRSLNTSVIASSDIPSIVALLLKAEPKLIESASLVEEQEAILIAGSVFGSHHRFDGVQGARMRGEEENLFILEATIVLKQAVQFDQPQADPILRKVWWFFYQGGGGTIGVVFLDWQVMKVLLNNSALSDFSKLRGQLGSLKGIGVRALKSLS
jgi:hypothetical protein